MGKDEYTEETPLTAVPDEPQFARTGCNALPCPVNLFSPKAEHRLGMIGVAAVGFIDCVSYGVIMPSIWAFLNEYGGSPHELGFALSAFSFAQLISYPIVGFWADRRSIKEAMLGTLFLGMVGNVLYCFTQIFAFRWFILIGRLVVGAAASNFALTNSYVQMTVGDSSRTATMAVMNGVTSVGLVLGPAINIGLVQLDFQIGFVNVNELTAPGWLMAILMAVLFLYFLLFFREPLHTAHEPTENPVLAYGRNCFNFTVVRAIGVTFLILFISNFNMSVLETICTPITKQYYNWTPFENSIFFAGVSGEAIVVTLIVAFISRFVKDRTLVLVGMIFSGAALVWMIIAWVDAGPNVYMFCIAGAVLFVGIPMLNSTMSSLYSKQIDLAVGPGRRSVFMGAFMIAGSAARIAGPAFAGPAVAFPTQRITFGILLCVWALGMVLLLVAFRRLNVEDQISQKGSEPQETDRLVGSIQEGEVRTIEPEV